MLRRLRHEERERLARIVQDHVLEILVVIAVIVAVVLVRDAGAPKTVVRATVAESRFVVERANDGRRRSVSRNRNPPSGQGPRACPVCSGAREEAVYCLTASICATIRTSFGTPKFNPKSTPKADRSMVVSKSPPQTSRLNTGLS